MPDSWSYDCDDAIDVEILGEGIRCEENAQITIPNPGNVTQIIAEVVYKGHTVNPEYLYFNTDNGPILALGTKTDPAGGYYYRALLDPSSFVGVELENRCKAQSFLLYVFRNDASAGASSGQFVESWMYHSTICKTLPIPQGPAPRDLNIIVPLSELTNDGRIVNISANAGGQSQSITINNFNQGDALNITPFILEQVPAATEEVEICVTSPTGTPNGQSLVFSGAIQVEPLCLTCDDSDLTANTEILSDYNGVPLSCVGANDAGARVEASGGLAPYTYLWSNGATTEEVSNLGAGEHTVIITDQFGCSIERVVIILPPVALECSATVSSNFNEGAPISAQGASDGAVAVQVSGGVAPYQFLWNDPTNQTSQEATNLPAGAYQVEVSDANGCTCQNSVVLNDPARLGDLVFEDKNANGRLDDGEPGIPNIEVQLHGTSDNGATIDRTTTTDANGYYDFDGLPAGNYQVKIVPTADLVITYPNEGDDESVDSDIYPDDQRSDSFILNLGAYNPNIDAGLYRLAKIGDFVWLDRNGNGVQDSEEAGFPEVTVELIGTSGNGTSVNQSTTTNAGGQYVFADLIPGNYQLKFSTPDAFLFSEGNQQGNDALDSDVDVQSGMTTVETLESNEVNSSYDAGLFQLSTIGDLVWEDLNGNGLQDSDEAGLPNVIVELSGTTSTGTEINASTVTNVDGNYSFSNVKPGIYTITFVLPSGFKFTYALEGTNGQVDSDADPMTGMTTSQGVQSGDQLDTFDAGLYRPASIGNLIWEDLNGNGIVESNEPGLSGVDVWLSGTTGNGTSIDQNTTSGASGNYSFNDLVPGTYQLTFSRPDGFKTTAPNQGNADSDSDANPVNGQSQTEDLRSGEDNETYDAGYFRPAALGNFVWEDTNGNGIQDPGELGLPNILVSLSGTDGTGADISQTATTDANGAYLFDDLPPGTYQLTFSPLSNYNFTASNEGTDERKDSDVDSASGTTALVVLPSGEIQTEVDAGLFAVSSIGDYVWLDCDKNGIQTNGEAGLAFVPISLSGTTGNGEVVNLNTASDENGFYEFINLKPGVYTLSFGFPASPIGLDYAPQNQGDEDQDSDVDANGLTDFIPLSSASNFTNIDAGYIDDAAPQIEPLAQDESVECDGFGNQDALSAWLTNNGGAQASDNITETGLILWTNNFNALTTACGASGKVTVTFTATDECGNSRNTTASFTIIDQTPPTLLGIPADEMVSCDAIPPLATPTASDDCSSEVAIDFQEIIQAGPCSHNYQLIRSWTATDECGNQDVQTQVISVEDNTAPILFGVPADETVECSTIPIAATPTATDNCDSDVSIGFGEVQSNGTCSDGYVLTRTWTATDACGNQSVQTQVITVEDNIAPTLIDVPADKTVDCAAIPTAAEPTATDNCDAAVSIVFSEIQEAGACTHNYNLIRTWTATDACGNQSIQTQIITVEDNTAPILLGVPSDETVACDVIPSAATPTATDNCDADVNIEFNEIQSSAACADTYMLTRTWTATDACGNQDIQTQIITVEDNLDPILIGIPSDETVACDAIPAIATPMATDNCDSDVNIEFSEMQTSATCADAYILTRTWTATDACGNQMIGTQVITVEDNVSPVLIGVPTDETVACDAIPAIATPTATDNCDSDVNISFSEVQSNTVCSNAHTLTRTWTATDACGNTSQQTQVITVEDNTPPVLLNVPTDEVVECDAIPSAASPTATDNCTDNVDISFSEVQSDAICPNAYTLTRTWTATDACGNQAVQTQIITVEDTTAPILLGVPANVNAACNTIPSPASPMATDNCDTEVLIILSEVQEAGSCSNSYHLIRTWTATDACGNSSQQSQIISIEDTTTPTLLNVPADETVDCNAVPSPASPTATDDCGTVVDIAFSEVQIPGNCPHNYGLIRTWTATDACGNSSQESQTITVLDTEAPILIGVPANTSADCQNIPTPVEPTATDNCDTNVSISFSEIQEPGNCGDTYQIVRTWTATDACGNSSQETQIIFIEDTTAPIISGVPTDITVACDAIPTPDEPIASDDCDDNVLLNFEEIQQAGDCSNNYVLIRVWTATDACGNQTQATQTITVEDTTSPILIGVPSDETVDCDFVPGPPAADLVIATDNCDANVAVVFAEIINPGTCLHQYTILRTWTATDACGNQDQQTQIITVEDNTAPDLIGVPSDQSVSCGGVPNPPVIGADLLANDNCDTDVTIGFNEIQAPGVCGESVIITRSWTATDACGNQNTATQIITVGDEAPPVISGVPANVVVECNMIPPIAEPTATDNCSVDIELGFFEMVEAGNCPSNYQIIRTWEATDACGNTSQASQIITVEDNTAPMLIGVPSDLNVSCDEIPPLPIDDVLATDNCDINVEITFNETTNSGACAGNLEIIRTWTAIDHCGNTTVMSQTISVLDEAAPVLSGIPADLTVECNAIPAPAQPTATDDCDEEVNISLSETISPIDCVDNFILTRIWTATDNCGKTTTAIQNITIQDTTDPILIGVPSDITVDPANGGVVPNLANVLATDNCDTNVSLAFDETEIPNGCGTILQRTWTATDNCGNSAVQTQIITVVDGFSVAISPENPEICAGTFVQFVADPLGNDVSYEWSATGGTFDDPNVGAPSYTATTPGSYTITLSVDGPGGCVGTASTIVTVTEDGVGTAGVNGNICEGDDIQLTASGGVIYFWTGPNNFTSNQQNPVIPNASVDDSGTYTVNIGGGNCSGIVDVEVLVSEGLVGDFNKTNVGCNNLGAINIGIFGGLGVYTYDWLDLPGTDNVEDRTDLEPGLYTVVVTDAGGCTYSIENIQIVDECGCSADAGGLMNGQSGLCLENGAVNLTATPNGNAVIPSGFSTLYVLTSGSDLVIEAVSNTPEFTVNEAGDYTIHTLIYDPITLNLGIIQFGVTTGAQVNSLLQQGGGTICAALDLLGVPFNVSVAEAFVSSVAPEICDGANGSALLAPSNYTYVWSDGGNGAGRNDLAAGVYEVTATDQNACSTTLSLTIDAICDCIPPVVNNIVLVETTCGAAEGSAVVLVAGNPADFTYDWFPNTGSPNAIGNVRNDLIAGVYSVTISNPLIDDCFVVEQFSIGNSDGPEPTSIETSPASCGEANGMATLLPNNYNYVWLFDNTPASSRNDLVAGVYEVLVVDPQNPDCPNIAIVEIGLINDLLLSATIEVQPTCQQADGIVNIEANGGTGNYLYQWSDGLDLTTGLRTGLSAGVYTVSVIDQQSNCETSLTFTLTNDVADASIELLSDEILLSCSGDSNGEVDFTITPSAGFVNPQSLSIQNANGEAVSNGNLIAGQYCIVVLDGNNCLAASTCFSVLEPEAIDVAVEVNNKTCTEGGSISLTVTGGNGGYSFNWQDLSGTSSPQNRENLVAGTYEVTITDQAGCSVVISDLLIADECSNPGNCTPPMVENTIVIGANCGQSNGSARLMLFGDETAFNYTWTPAVSETNMADHLSSGVYTVVISDLDDPTCSTTISFTVENIDGPQAELLSTTPATCAQLNGTAVLSPVSFVYEWCNGATGFNVVNLPAGTCFVTVTNPADGCTNILEVFIEEFNTLTLTPMILDFPDCGAATGAVNIEVSGGSTDYTYQWSNGADNATANNLAAGIYSVTVTDNGATGCSQILTFALWDDIVDAGAMVTLESDSVFVTCVGATDGTVNFDISLEANFVEPATVTISDIDGNEYTNGALPPGEYCVLVRDADGCLGGQACFQVLPAPSIVLDISLFNQTCDTSGMILVSASGGTGSYAFDWADLSGPFNPQNRIDLEVGAYSLTVSDANGCTTVVNDLPIIDECSGCPAIDTVQLGLPINSQGTYCFELESCFDTVGITYALYDGGTIGSSPFGNWSLGVDGCLTYNSNDTPGLGVDTICIVANDNGLLDTTCVVVTITTDCALFGTDTIQLQTFDCEAGGNFCLPIGLTQIVNFDILDNGEPYSGGFEGCESDTTITYLLQILINDAPVGPYELVSWNVESTTFSIDTFQTLDDLVDSMNIWDPAGDWALVPNTAIVSNNTQTNYGPLNIRPYLTLNPAILGVNLNIDNMGTLITLDTGFHQIIISDLNTGCVDTLNVGLDCVDCPNIYDGPNVLLAPNCNELLDVCLNLDINEVQNYVVTDNGELYTDGFNGCDLDSIYTYVALAFINPGNYTLDSWEVNGALFSLANFNTVEELIDSMNVWDPMANWTLDGVGIEGGNFANDYGALVVSQNGIVLTTSMPSLDLFPNGLAVSLDTGFHQLIVTNTLKGCVDTLELTIDCVDCPEDFYSGPDLLMANGCDSLTQLCLGLSAINLSNYQITDNGAIYNDGFIGCDFDSIYTYVSLAFSQPGNYTLNSWQVNNVFFSMGNFVSVQELVDSMNVWDPNGNWTIDGTAIEGGDFDNIYGSLIVSQFGIEITNSAPTLNLDPQGLQIALDTGFHEIIIVDSIAGCLDTFEVTILCDDFSPLPTDTIPLELIIGFTDTFCIDTTVLPSIIDTIYNICESASGSILEFGILEDDFCIEYTALDLGTEPACIVICDDQNHCDTTVLEVTVIPPMIDSVSQELVFGEIDQYCIDTSELAGTIDTIFNFCEGESGENILFSIDESTLCVSFEGVGLGADQACIVICDHFGFCDTTILLVNNLMGLGEEPIAVEDDTSTVINVPLIIDVLGNDTLNGVLLDVQFLNGPWNGAAVLNTDFSFTYAPNRDECAYLDSFTYILISSTGSDTASVFVDVLCDELTIYNGMSPNDDGMNDSFTIIGIELFPSSEVTIFNRWGNQVYYKQGYQNEGLDAFKGQWNGKDLPDGTYFYLIDTGEGTQYSGYLQIHR
ncbi:MAG: SdrD B-like domain-containing protein [Bacteroidota bacterium]